MRYYLPPNETVEDGWILEDDGWVKKDKDNIKWVYDGEEMCILDEDSKKLIVDRNDVIYLKDPVTKVLIAKEDPTTGNWVDTNQRSSKQNTIIYPESLSESNHEIHKTTIPIVDTYREQPKDDYLYNSSQGAKKMNTTNSNEAYLNQLNIERNFVKNNHADSALKDYLEKKKINELRRYVTLGLLDGSVSNRFLLESRRNNSDFLYHGKAADVYYDNIDHINEFNSNLIELLKQIRFVCKKIIQIAQWSKKTSEEDKILFFLASTFLEVFDTKLSECRSDNSVFSSSISSILYPNTNYDPIILQTMCKRLKSVIKIRLKSGITKLVEVSKNGKKPVDECINKLGKVFQTFLKYSIEQINESRIHSNTNFEIQNF